MSSRRSPSRDGSWSRLAAYGTALLVTASFTAAATAAPLFEETKLIASDGVSQDHFGRAVAVYGQTVVVGSSSDDGQGSAYVYARSRHGWEEAGKLTAFDGAPDDLFGYAVAISGDTIVVGAPLDDVNGEGSGSVYVFVRYGDSWVLQAKLTPSNPARGDNFGTSVALDHTTLVVGGPWRDPDPDVFGSAYVFARLGGSWIETAALDVPAGAPQGSNFGLAVAVAADTVVVTAAFEDEDGDVSGSAHVYSRTPSSWVESAELVASDGTALDSFGWSVAIGRAGNLVVVGAPSDGDAGFGPQSAYVFTRTSGVWREAAIVTASDGDPVGYGDRFGATVAVAGEVVIVGAPLHDGNGQDSGLAYLFTRWGDSWFETAKYSAADGTSDDTLGSSAAADGITVALGAPGDDFNGTASGSAYVVELAERIGPPACTVTGTSGDDVLIGTPGSDVICGRGGDDVIYGLAGNDVLRGGSGDDRIFGGEGSDIINGHSGNDYLIGGAHGDTIRGGRGDDVLRGRRGHDRLKGNMDNDTLWGGKGNDALYGGAGLDRCDGGLGENEMVGC